MKMGQKQLSMTAAGPPVDNVRVQQQVRIPSQVKLCLAGVQLINLAAFLFRGWELQDESRGLMMCCEGLQHTNSRSQE